MSRFDDGVSPGPWEWQPHDGAHSIVDRDGSLVAVVGTAADANLIAAAWQTARVMRVAWRGRFGRDTAA